MVEGLDAEEEGEDGCVWGEKLRVGGGGGRSEVDEMIWMWSVSICVGTNSAQSQIRNHPTR